MTRSRPRAFALLLLLCLCLLPARADAELELEYTRYRLDNGLDVVLHVDRRVPTVAVNLSYHVGRAHDGANPGLAHVVEHLMFRGTQGRDDGDFMQALQRAGAIGTNARTLETRTAYLSTVPRDRIGLILDLESDRMANLSPALDGDKLRQEKKTTIDEWETRVISERFALTLAIAEHQLFPAPHPFHHATSGEIERLTLVAVKLFLADRHGPGNATLVLAGDLPDDIEAQIERHFAPLRGGSPPPKLELDRPEPTAEQRVRLEATQATTPVVILVWETPGGYEAGDAEADVLTRALGKGRLDAMLEAHAPGRFISSSIRQFSRPGSSLFLLGGEGTAGASVDELEAALEAVLAEVRARAVSADDARRARKSLQLDLVRQLQRIDGRAAQMQRYIAYGKDPDWVDEDFARYGAVDELGVAHFVDTYLGDERRVTVRSPVAEGEAP